MQTGKRYSISEHFQPQVKRPNKRISRDKGPNKTVKARPPRTGGTGDSILLIAGPQPFQVQITNVNSELEVDDIKKFIVNKEMGIEMINIEDKTSEGCQTKRFLLTFDYKHYEQVMSADFWPKKIYFR